MIPPGTPVPDNIVYDSEAQIAWACGKSQSSTPTSGQTTGSPVGDALNLGANLWIAQNIKNPYTAVFAQNFTQGFLTSFFRNSAERERQQQLMNEAIQTQLQEAAEKARLAEKQRIEAMFARLNGELKLSGSPTYLALKTSGAPSELPLKLSPAADSGQGLQLKLGEGNTHGAGINGLPGIYVGGPATANTGDAGGLQLKVGDRGAVAASGSSPPVAAGSMGIPGLPGVYLNDVPPEQAADLANVAANLSGPERRVAEEAALAAAQKNPELTGVSDEPFVQDYQREAQDYSAALQAQQVAWQNAVEAEGHVQADKTTIDYVRGQIDPGHAAEEQTQAIQNMLSSEKSDEAIAVNARQMFEQTDIHLTTVRHEAADSLAVLAMPTTNVSADVPYPGSATSSMASAQVPASGSANTSLPVIDPRRMTVPVLATPLTGGKPVVESIQACLARTSNRPVGSPAPTVEELQRQLESNIKAIERLAKYQEGGLALKEDWSKELHDAHLDIFNNGTDALLDGLLGVTKTHLELDKKAYHDALEESMKESRQLRWEHQATAGFGAPNPIVEANIADYSKRAQALVEQRKGIEGRLETVESMVSGFAKYKNGRDFYLWLTDNAVLPCKFENDGKIDCEELMKNNGVRKLVNGDLVDRLDQLKQLIKIGVKLAEPTAEFTPYGVLAVTTYEFGSMSVDLIYDEAAVYFSKERLRQVKQNDAQFARARELLGARMEKLTAEIGCYEKANPTSLPEAAR